MGILDSLPDLRTGFGLTRSLERARVDQERSKQLVAQKIADSEASVFVEKWADLTAWSANTGIAVSGGRLVGNSGTAATAGINHAYPLAATEVARVATSIKHVYSGSGGVIIGVSNDAPGAVPASSASSARGLYFEGGGAIRQWDGAAGATLKATAGAFTTVDYTVTIAVDPTYIAVTAVLTGGASDQTLEYRARWLRSGFTVNNIFIFNTSVPAGVNVGPIGARKALQPVAAPTSTAGAGIEGVGRSVLWVNHNSYNIHASFPTNYDARYPSPVVMFFHGHGSNELAISDNATTNFVQRALINAGFVVISTTATSTTTWGAQASMDAYASAYKWVRDNVNMGTLVVYANSMGSIESLNAIGRNVIPGVQAWVGTAPTFSLAANYAQSFTGAIDAAYGVSGGNYATATKGFDPALMPASAWKGLPMLISASPDDTTVLTAENADKLQGAVTPVATELVRLVGTGAHSDPSISPSATITAFLAKYAL